ncbi:hypothetical protein L6452_26927 [Arctium lappa]|uniref:Uncharacterized protein n=1 Tax=Arctium lappa TaxID=4217 RepID=A0ACB8ZUI6_ARCLA|nr:hypothetical protein L6452_26927 [Arctium lappa]
MREIRKIGRRKRERDGRSFADVLKGNAITSSLREHCRVKLQSEGNLETASRIDEEEDIMVDHKLVRIRVIENEEFCPSWEFETNIPDYTDLSSDSDDDFVVDEEMEGDTEDESFDRVSYSFSKNDLSKDNANKVGESERMRKTSKMIADSCSVMASENEKREMPETGDRTVNGKIDSPILDEKEGDVSILKVVAGEEYGCNYDRGFYQ